MTRSCFHPDFTLKGRTLKRMMEWYIKYGFLNLVPAGLNHVRAGRGTAPPPPETRAAPSPGAFGKSGPGCKANHQVGSWTVVRDKGRGKKRSSMSGTGLAVAASEIILENSFGALFIA